MIDSQHHSWVVHLQGARSIYRTLYHGKRAVHSQVDILIQRFLVSMFSYIDAAGQCATSDGTVVSGSYWALDGGLEFQSGPPSLYFGPFTLANGGHLVELRLSWCAMMEIQVSISVFGKAKQRWMPFEQQDQTYSDLFNRTVAWRANVPDPLRRLAELDGESFQQYRYPDVIEQVSCIEAYEKATIVYLHRILAAGRPDRQPDSDMIDALVCRILLLISTLVTGVRQLASVWPLFIAGWGARQEDQQQLVREKLTGLQHSGFKVRSDEKYRYI